MNLPDYPYKWKHKKCGRIIYFTKKIFSTGEVISREFFVKINGMKPQESTLICPHCKEALGATSADIEQSRRNA
jgi:predicted nucleic-acid-binding Zn-ribbon protein